MPNTCSLIMCDGFFLPKVYYFGKFCRLASNNKHKCVIRTLFVFVILSVVKPSSV